MTSLQQRATHHCQQLCAPPCKENMNNNKKKKACRRFCVSWKPPPLIHREALFAHKKASKSQAHPQSDSAAVTALKGCAGESWISKFQHDLYTFLTFYRDFTHTANFCQSFANMMRNLLQQVTLWNKETSAFIIFCLKIGLWKLPIK